MLKELGVNILSIAYRGYSYSEGTPSEKGLQIDAKAIIKFLENPDLVDEEIAAKINP
jgi:hypothetical protein